MRLRGLIQIGLVISAAALTTRTANAQGLEYYPVAPCRIADTRGPTGPTGGPAITGAYRHFPIKGGSCGVPQEAVAAALNLTITQPTGFGHLTMWQYSLPAPQVSNINFAAGEIGIANGAIVRLSTDLSLHVSVYAAVAGAGSTHLIIDVVGYFAP